MNFCANKTTLVLKNNRLFDSIIVDTPIILVVMITSQVLKSYSIRWPVQCLSPIYASQTCQSIDPNMTAATMACWWSAAAAGHRASTSRTSTRTRAVRKSARYRRWRAAAASCSPRTACSCGPRTRACSAPSTAPSSSGSVCIAALKLV